MKNGVGGTGTLQVTGTAGRGVGMGAVRRAVEGLGGRMLLESVEGRGTTTILQLREEAAASERKAVG